MRQDRRGSWYLLTGAVLGVAAGLIYSWLISPVKYVEAPPYVLRADYKDDYRALIATAYLYSNDLLRAEERLQQLKDDNPAQALTLQAQRALAEGHPNEEIQALRSLAMALTGNASQESNNPQSISTIIPTIATPMITPLIPLPTATISTTIQVSAIPIDALVQITTRTP